MRSGRGLLVALAGLLVLAPSGPAPGEPSPQGRALLGLAPATAPLPASWRARPFVRRERFAALEPAARALLAARRGPLRWRLDLFPDTALELVLERRDRSGSAAIWAGRVVGQPQSSVTLALRGASLHGLVQLPGGEHFELSSAPGGLLRVLELDPLAMPPERAPLASAGPAEPAASPPPGAAGTPSAIDVMLVYTPAARDAAGGVGAIEARMQQAIALANQAYAASDVPIEHRLVHTQEVAYVETSSDAFGEALDRITDTNDGVMDEVHGLRDSYGADVVGLLIDDSSWCGLAWITTPWTSWAQANAFSVNYWHCVGSGVTLHHEIGHNQGLAHDVDNASVSGAYPYSHGLQVDDQFHTVMAYRSGCASPCPSINRFSNPAVDYGGTPTGIAEQADNARSLDETRDFVAAWRAAVLDADSDGILDDDDNCRLAANADQRDSNGDGYGNVCDADYDGDGVVELSDFSALAQAFGTSLGGPGYDADLDADGDGAIELSDYGVLAASFGGVPGPSGCLEAGGCP